LPENEAGQRGVAPVRMESGRAVPPGSGEN